MRIRKYDLKLTDRQIVEMPAASNILSVANQQDALCLWAMVDPSNPISVQRDIEIIDTGFLILDAKRTFLGTVVIDPFVLHVFERQEDGSECNEQA